MKRFWFILTVFLLFVIFPVTGEEPVTVNNGDVTDNYSQYNYTELSRSGFDPFGEVSINYMNISSRFAFGVNEDMRNALLKFPDSARAYNSYRRKNTAGNILILGGTGIMMTSGFVPLFINGLDSFNYTRDVGMVLGLTGIGLVSTITGLFIHTAGTESLFRGINMFNRNRRDANELIPAEETAGIPNATAINPEKLTFSINANPAGLFLFGPSVNMEFTKGNFNSEINVIFPSLNLFEGAGGGFGLMGLFNYFWHSRIGGVYAGGGMGYIYSIVNERHDLVFGVNAGYKFFTKSGIYYRAGGFVGMGLENFSQAAFIIKPDLSVGYSF